MPRGNGTDGGPEAGAGRQRKVIQKTGPGHGVQGGRLAAAGSGNELVVIRMQGDTVTSQGPRVRGQLEELNGRREGQRCLWEAVKGSGPSRLLGQAPQSGLSW